MEVAIFNQAANVSFKAWDSAYGFASRYWKVPRDLGPWTDTLTNRLICKIEKMVIVDIEVARHALLNRVNANIDEVARHALLNRVNANIDEVINCSCWIPWLKSIGYDHYNAPNINARVRLAPISNLPMMNSHLAARVDWRAIILVYLVMGGDSKEIPHNLKDNFVLNYRFGKISGWADNNGIYCNVLTHVANRDHIANPQRQVQEQERVRILQQQVLQQQALQQVLQQEGVQQEQEGVQQQEQARRQQQERVQQQARQQQQERVQQQEQARQQQQERERQQEQERKIQQIESWYTLVTTGATFAIINTENAIYAHDRIDAIGDIDFPDLLDDDQLRRSMTSTKFKQVIPELMDLMLILIRSVSTGLGINVEDIKINNIISIANTILGLNIDEFRAEQILILQTANNNGINVDEINVVPQAERQQLILRTENLETEAREFRQECIDRHVDNIINPLSSDRISFLRNIMQYIFDARNFAQLRNIRSTDIAIDALYTLFKQLRMIQMAMLIPGGCYKRDPVWVWLGGGI